MLQNLNNFINRLDHLGSTISGEPPQRIRVNWGGEVTRSGLELPKPFSHFENHPNFK